ncbi:MAG: hypothetical protein ACI9WC_002182 [Arenicella sp.]
MAASVHLGKSVVYYSLTVIVVLPSNLLFENY